MGKFEDQMNAIANRTKVKVFKPVDRLDDRLTLCGEHVQHDDEGRQFFIVPAHAVEYQSKLHPHYEFGEPYVEEVEKKKAGRPAKESE